MRICCCQCATATAADKTMGMPWCLGFCCTNMCLVRNLERYQYRISGNDYLEECFLPILLSTIGLGIVAFIPCTWCCIFPVFTIWGMQILEEPDKHPSSSRRRYLESYPERTVEMPQQVIIVTNQHQPVVVVGGPPQYQYVAAGAAPQYQYAAVPNAPPQNQYVAAGATPQYQYAAAPNAPPQYVATNSNYKPHTVVPQTQVYDEENPPIVVATVINES
jgi:hypothetical protein